MKLTIFVFGEGVGTLIIARKLIRNVGNDDDIKSVGMLFFEKEGNNQVTSSLTLMMVGKREDKQIYGDQFPLEWGRIKAIRRERESVDSEKRTVLINDNKYKGIDMVISLGIELTTPPDLGKYRHNLKHSERI